MLIIFSDIASIFDMTPRCVEAGRAETLRRAEATGCIVCEERAFIRRVPA